MKLLLPWLTIQVYFSIQIWKEGFETNHPPYVHSTQFIPSSADPTAIDQKTNKLTWHPLKHKLDTNAWFPYPYNLTQVYEDCVQSLTVLITNFTFAGHTLVTWLPVYHCCEYQCKADAANKTSTQLEYHGHSASECHQWYSPSLTTLDCKLERSPENKALLQRQ